MAILNCQRVHIIISGEHLLDPLIYDYVNVIASRLLPAFCETLDSYRAFTVLYDSTANGDKDLAMHYDNAEVTLNINIGGTWGGGNVAWWKTARCLFDVICFSDGLWLFLGVTRRRSQCWLSRPGRLLRFSHQQGRWPKGRGDFASWLGRLPCWPGVAWPAKIQKGSMLVLLGYVYVYV